MGPPVRNSNAGKEHTGFQRGAYVPRIFRIKSDNSPGLNGKPRKHKKHVDVNVSLEDDDFLLMRSLGGSSKFAKWATDRKVASGVDVQGERLEKAINLRKEHDIEVWGTDVPEPYATFEEMIQRCKLSDGLAKNIRRLLENWTPTPIQMQVIPAMINQREILGSAPTGSGKTLSFILPILHRLKEPKKCGFRALIVEPTRELAKQVYHDFLRLTDQLGFKVDLLSDIKIGVKRYCGPKAKKNVDILITTPNRLVGLLQYKKPIDLSNVEWLIIDESDKLFEKGERGFRKQLAVIYGACKSSKCRRGLFSATFAFEVEQWCKENLDNVIVVSVGEKNSAVKSVNQQLVFTGTEFGKIVELENMFRAGIPPPVLIFVQSKTRALDLFKQLRVVCPKLGVIHASQDSEQRDALIRDFRIGEIWVLIATDLMGRGLDIRCLNVVINYDFPVSAISYIHRIGRAGRAGRTGKAVTFFTEQDIPLLKKVATVISKAGCPVPEYLLELPTLPAKTLKRFEENAPRRPGVSAAYSLPPPRLRPAGAPKKSKSSQDRKTKKPTTLEQSEEGPKKKKSKRTVNES